MHAYIHSVQWQVSNILTLPFTTISFSTEVFRSSDNLLTGQLPQFPVKISKFGHVPGSLHLYYPIELFFSNPFRFFIYLQNRTPWHQGQCTDWRSLWQQAFEASKFRYVHTKLCTDIKMNQSVLEVGPYTVFHSFQIIRSIIHRW